jgi:hypothetical protein
MFTPFKKKNADASKASPFANSKQPPAAKSDPKARLEATLVGLKKAK